MVCSKDIYHSNRERNDALNGLVFPPVTLNFLGTNKSGIIEFTAN